MKKNTNGEIPEIREESGEGGRTGDEAGRQGVPASSYLIACDRNTERRRQELLYEVLGPVFFGRREAASETELAELFVARYGIDVYHDFCDGDEHYEEYLEAQQAIAEGLCIYGGEIVFTDSAMAELAERIWRDMEERGGFRRINTMLEE